MSAALGQKINLPLWAVNSLVVGAGVVIDTRGLSVAQYLSGRVTGNFASDVALTLDVFEDATEAGVSAAVAPTWTVPRDAGLPGFQYPFTIQLFQPFLRLRVTVGGAPTTFLRGNAQAIPQ